MIKVAVVGTNGLAQYIVNCLATQTSHQFVILSRRASSDQSSVENDPDIFQPSPGLTAKGWQVLQVHSFSYLSTNIPLLLPHAQPWPGQEPDLCPVVDTLSLC